MGFARLRLHWVIGVDFGVVMAQRRGIGRRGVRGEGFMVKNGKDDGYDYNNSNRHEIKELMAQIATLSDKVQYMLNRQVATLMKKVQRLLPLSKGTNDSQSQLESSFDYKEKTNIDDGLVKSHENFKPNEFEEERIFNTNEVGGGLKDDNPFEIDDKSEELPIFDESPNEDFVGKFEGVLVYGEFPNHDIDGDDDVSPFLHEELEDDFKDGGFKDYLSLMSSKKRKMILNVTLSCRLEKILRMTLSLRLEVIWKMILSLRVVVNLKML